MGARDTIIEAPITPRFLAHARNDTIASSRFYLALLLPATCHLPPAACHLPHGTARETGSAGGATMIDRRTQDAGVLSRFASWATEWTGSTAAFLCAAAVIVVWLATGPLFHFSDTWQLVINTGTTIVTFLMVFLIQRAQNKDTLALQLKLNELVAAIEGASNRLISVEDLSEQELHVLHTHYKRLAEMAKSDRTVTESHSIEEAEARHEFKRDRRKKR
jgi:low affinity Fe/Cu permease